MLNKKNRPKAFEFFDNNPKNSNLGKKINWKNIRRIIKLIIYFLIFGITLTGCIQSFVVKTSFNVGEGVEFYQNDSEVTPNYTILSTETKGKSYEVVPINKSNNFLISADKVKSNNDQNILSLLKEQSEKNGNSQKYFGQHSSLILYKNNNNSFEYLKGDLDNEFLFITSGDKVYKQKNRWTDIKVPSPKFYLKNGDIDIAKELFKQTSNTEDKDSPFFFTINNDLVPSYKKNASFSRDIIQSIYNKIDTNTLGFSKDELQTAIEEYETKKGEGVSDKNKNIIEKYSLYFANLLKNLNYNKINLEKNTYEFNLDKADGSYKKFAFENNVASSPIVTWGDSWAYGPFYSIFVYPLSKIILGVSESQSLIEWNGWITILAIVMVVVLTKIISFMFRFKTIFGQSKQIELQAKKAKIDAKYEPYKNNKVMQQRQRQEVAELYKKNNFSPFAPFSQALVTMPIFIAVWRVLQGIPSLKVTYFLGLELSATSYQKLFSGEWIYLPIMIVVVVTQVLQQWIPKWLNKTKTQRIMNSSESEAMKKQLKTQRIMSIVFIFIGLLFQASLQIYWIIGALWEISQSLGVHYLQKSKVYREKMQPWLRKKKIL